MPISALEALQLPVTSHCVDAKNEGTFISRILDACNNSFHFATLCLAQEHFSKVGVCHAPADLQASCSVLPCTQRTTAA